MHTRQALYTKSQPRSLLHLCCVLRDASNLSQLYTPLATCSSCLRNPPLPRREPLENALLPTHTPVDWNTPLLHWQYRWAKASIIRSIFWASPGSRKLHRNCLRVETEALLWPVLLLLVALISEGKGRWGGFRSLLLKLNRSEFSHCPFLWF